MKTVEFTEMSKGTKEEYAFLADEEKKYIASLPDRLIKALEDLEDSFGGYQISRLEHSLQSATRALEAGENEEMIIAALLHDIGDPLAPHSHSEMAAAVLRPYVSERIHWIIKHHGLFQSYYYAHHFDNDRNAREMHKDHPWYQDCVDFCEHYDQNCFDPNYESKSLAYFRPMLERVFSRPQNFAL
ncbi:MAG: HD domain-containing protein [Granulosicoccus sp.]|nr:HD domain-containing protein [Granulosicoccus sp.]